MRPLIGVDEAGRGPLAGPVAVGFVRAMEGFDIAREFPGVADSKALSPKKREKIYELLASRQAQGDIMFRVEFESADAIDSKGIAVVIREAVARGIASLALEMRGVHVLLDGALRAPDTYSQETIIGGDATVPIISLASIVAKVERDRMMLELAKTYPEYGFEKHKGYGTSAHYEQLRKYGLSAIHRKTFIHLDS